MGSTSSTQTFTPWGSDEQRNLLDTTNAQYKSISNLFPEMLSQVQSTYSAVDPQTSINAQRTAGQKSINDYYTPQYRSANQTNVARFGGMNNTVGRDTQAEIGKQEGNAVSNLETGLQSNLYNMQQQQYRNALTNLGLQANYGNYLEGIIKQSPTMMPTTYTTNNGSWADWAQPAIAGGGLALAALMALSDKNAKKDIKKIGEIKGINVYEFEYKPEYNQPKGKQIGVIAQEIENIIPNSVKDINGLKHVDYSKVINYMEAV